MSMQAYVGFCVCLNMKRKRERCLLTCCTADTHCSLNTDWWSNVTLLGGPFCRGQEGKLTSGPPPQVFPCSCPPTLSKTSNKMYLFIFFSQKLYLIGILFWSNSVYMHKSDFERNVRSVWHSSSVDSRQTWAAAVCVRISFFIDICDCSMETCF